MECPYCGAENRPGVRFCHNCGKQLNPADTTSTSSPTSTAGTARTGGNSRSLTPGARLQGGRYVVRKILGQGGMGAALLATDLRLDSKPVVIKELISDNTDPTKMQEDVRNFKREVSTLAHLDHPLIPNVTDHFQEGPRYFMVQEYVDGENLEDRMDRVNQPMKEREALGYASEVLDILDYLSQETPPIVHRDIKPANIIIGNKDKRAHLVDFGIARADVQRKQTSALGTPGYAPPEQYQGNADPRSDLYALAATLHHLLTNRDPRNHPPFTYPPARTLNPQLSPEIERVLTKALNNDINQRYQSAAAMKREVDDILLTRFGVSGNTNSYVLGTSGPITTLPGATTTPTLPSQRQTPPPPPPPPLASPPSQTQRPQPSPIRSIGAGSPYQQPGIGSYNQPIPQPRRRRNNSVLIGAILLALVVLLIVGGAFAIPRLLPGKSSTTTTPGSTPAATATTGNIGGIINGIGVVTASDGESIGISDGTVAFAVTGPGGNNKIQAADKLKSGDSIAAGSLWRAALSSDPGDAESLIYLEDQQVLRDHSNSNTPYVTIVVGSLLTGNNASVGRDDLQGAYVAQKEYNDAARRNGGTLVRLLLANSGNDKSYATTVANQIVQLVKDDPTVVGVMGWPFSSHALAAIDILTRAHIPMVSQTASSDSLTGISPYFFRVNPSDTTQGAVGAKYVEQTLHAKNVALFVDNADPYSQSLATAFSTQFKNDGNTIIVTEAYTVGPAGRAALPKLLQDAESKNPDLIYFAGYASDAGVLLANLPTSGPYAHLAVMGGDALYELQGYPPSAGPGFNRLRFTSFAYPDEWDVQHLTASKPAFFNDYIAAYNPHNQHSLGTYGYTRADGDVILSYDALMTLLHASNLALTSHKPITAADLQQALSHLNGSNAFQGVSGQIALGQDGNPINKAILVLFVDPKGHFQMDSVQGCFQVGKCG